MTTLSPPARIAFLNYFICDGPVCHGHYVLNLSCKPTNLQSRAVASFLCGCVSVCLGTIQHTQELHLHLAGRDPPPLSLLPLHTNKHGTIPPLYLVWQRAPLGIVPDINQVMML